MKDWVLEALVKLGEDMEEKGPDRGGVHITLCVGGLLVSGQLISSKLYFRMFGDGFIHDIVEKAVASGELPGGGSPDGPPGEPPRFIHLASAKFLLGAHD